MNRIPEVGIHSIRKLIIPRFRLALLYPKERVFLCLK
nr:MAG TPA: hypothetical protein [Caudoviricetes sp.]